MKLSDFNTKVPVHKKSSLVFNLNNEKRELAASIQIKALETELASLKNELLQLRKKLRSNILLVVDDAYNEYIQKRNYASGLKLL